MLQSDSGAGTPQLDFEGRRVLLRSNCGGKVTAPNAFAGWMGPLSACSEFIYSISLGARRVSSTPSHPAGFRPAS
jgi:hypothetical protein